MVTLMNNDPVETTTWKSSHSFSSTENCSILSEDQLYASLMSLIKQSEGIESGFGSLDDFLRYSSTSMHWEAQQELQGNLVEEKVSRASKVKQKLKQLKATKTSPHDVKKQLKRILKKSAAIPRVIFNGSALIFRGGTALMVNVMMVLVLFLAIL